MKVAIIVDNIPARIERLTKIATSLNSSGNDVIVFCPSSVQVLPQYRVVRVPCLGNNPLAHYLTFALGIFLILLALPKRIVHYVNHPDFAVPAVCAASKLAGHKLVYDRRVDFGGVVARRHPRAARLARVLEEIGCRYAAAITVDAPSRKQRCLKYLSKLEVIPNGVELEKFNIQKKKHSGFVVTCVAALTEVEGVDVFIRAASLARKQDSSMTFRVVGDGELRAQLVQLSESLGHSVDFLGWIPHDQIPELLAASDVCVSCVLPIYYSHGAYPVKLFEYLASGTPTVVSDVPGHLEIVTEGHDALVYKAHDPADLAAKIVNLRQNHQLRVNLSRNGRLTANKYSWDKSFRKLEEIYHQLEASGRFQVVTQSYPDSSS
jgi:glycosyltransferase involved in cell wall biosynthesis